MIDNVSQITMFFLSGLNETKNHQSALFCLTLLCYCVILLANVSLIVIIFLDKNLHEPMYILLCNLCINGIYVTTGFYPKFLWDLISPVHVISYSGYLLQALVMYSFPCSDLSILAVMAYDRYVVICQPLEYHSTMSKQKLLKLVCFSWLTPFCISATNMYLTYRLKLCSPYIARLYCVYWSIVKLACLPAETIVNSIFTYIIILIYVSHCAFIVWSYMYLIKTCVNSLENRAKFMQTCVPHLTSLLIFVVTVLFDVMYMRFGSQDSLQTFQNFVAIEYLFIPTIMNPVIYGLKLTKIQNRVRGFITLRPNNFK